MATRNVVLTDGNEIFIAQQIRKGGYQNYSEVLRAGLRVLEENTKVYDAKIEALVAQAQIGWNDLDAGRSTDISTDERLDNVMGDIKRSSEE